ncbi:MAG: hypothetical protein HKN75_09485, partial [Bacteroidia bacterium]|nr:hypothetical protein [Bacteroidia bacterium]
TFGHLLNCEFAHPQVKEEIALNPLAGGILNEGHQCGMLWGAAMATGSESYKKHADKDEAIAVAITATQHVIDSFVKRTNTVNCKEIIGFNLKSVFGMAAFMLKVTLQGMDNSHCFNLAEDWAPEAIAASKEGLDEHVELKHKPMSCASEVAKRMGATDEQQVMVAGFAGGLGLSGNGCGALSAAIWMKMVQWLEKHPGKKPPYLNNPYANKILKAFKAETNSEMLCHKITGQKFDNLDEHSEFIKNGGCKKLIDILSLNRN